MTKQELENKIAILLGGRAAELVVFNHLSTGAANDLMRATEIAHSMVTRYGMSDKLGSMAYERENRSLMATPGMPRSHDRDYGEETARAVDDETRKIVDAALQRARRILEERRDVLDHSAKRLLDKETIDEAELIELIGPPAEPTLSLVAE